MQGRLRSIAVLKRLHDIALKERSVELVELQDRLSLLELARGDLQRKRLHESTVTMTEAMPYLSTFLNHMRKEDKKLAEAQRVVTGHVDRVREQVLENYRDFKSAESYEASIHRKIREDAERVEAAGVDEQNIISYARKVREYAIS